MHIKQLTGILLAAVLGSAFTLGVTGNLFSEKKESIVRVEHHNSLPIQQTRYGTDAGLLDFTVAAEAAMPAVVHIKSTNLRPTGNAQGQNRLPDIFRDFFGDEFFGPELRQRPGQPRPQVGTGSGVILSADGYIVTNNHVIDQADDIEVSLNDNRSYKAEVVGTDPSTDLALLKIEADDLTPVALANSEEVRVGEWVLAVGNPFSLNSTATAGIVSAKARNINILKDRGAIESFIQTDAAVNPGNSGGALVNLNGELIGINTAIASPTGAYSGYAFAVPSNLMRKVVQDLMEYGEVQRGYLGILIRNVDAGLAEEEGLDLTEGIYVDSLMGNSAAAEAGLETGDVILGVSGHPVKTVSELQAAIGLGRPGDAIPITINRDGKEKKLTVTLRNRDGNTGLVAKAETPAFNTLGAELETLSASTAKELDLEGGVQVKSLQRGILSQQTDMQEGFIITRIDNKPVRDVEELEKMLEDREGGVMLEGRYPDYPGTYYYAFGMGG